MLEQGKQYSASDFKALKDKVRAEMLRRCYEGSLEAYGGENYDFVIEPEKGSQILAEQVNKIIEPINQIKDSGFTIQNIGDPAKAMNMLDELVTTYSGAALEGDGHFCNASCTGLCSTGCGGSCSGGCKGGCKSSCVNGCAYECTTSCYGTCYGGCGDGCSNSCASTCAQTCSVSAGEV